MLVSRGFVCGVLLLGAVSLSFAEPPIPVPPASGAPNIRLGKGTVVLYPVPDQRDAGAIFPGNEYPDPIPKARTPLAGYPITATFAAGMKVTDASGTLLDDKNREVPGWFSSPAEPANSNYKSSQRNTLCFIPIRPLQFGTTYHVRMEAVVDGEVWRKAWKFTTERDVDPVENIKPVLACLNAYRKAANLPGVDLDTDLSRACQAHARYLARNLPARPDLATHVEDPKLEGFTAEGNKVAPETVVLRGMVGVEAMEFMFGVYLNRAVMLYPGLKKVGIGVARDPAGGQLWIFEPYQFAEPVVVKTPTCFPAPDQKNVPLAYPGAGTTHPVADPKLRDQAGFAISAIFWRAEKFRDVQARLCKRAGIEVECWHSSPLAPAIKGTPQNSITLIPKANLEPATNYEVRMSATLDGRPWEATWSFTTEPVNARAAESARQTTLALKLLNGYRATCGLQPVRMDARLGSGCEKHALYLKQNNGHPTTEGLGMHNEDPKLPGYSADGAAAGKAGVITFVAEPSAAVPTWMDTLYHRIPLLDPNLAQVGFACVPLADGRWICVMHARP